MQELKEFENILAERESKIYKTIDSVNFKESKENTRVKIDS